MDQIKIITNQIILNGFKIRLIHYLIGLINPIRTGIK